MTPSAAEWVLLREAHGIMGSNPGTHFTPAMHLVVCPPLGGTHCPPWGDGVPSSENCCGRTCIHLTFLWIRSLEGKPGSGCRASETSTVMSVPPEGCCTGCPLRVRSHEPSPQDQDGGPDVGEGNGPAFRAPIGVWMKSPFPSAQRPPPHSDLCQDGHMKTVPRE